MGERAERAVSRRRSHRGFQPLPVAICTAAIPSTRAFLAFAPSKAARCTRARDLQWRSDMHLILFLVFGLIVGALARLLVPGKEPGGWIISMLLGVAGSFVGGMAGRALGLYREGEPAGFVMSLLGAVVLVLLYHMVARRRHALG